MLRSFVMSCGNRVSCLLVVFLAGVAFELPVLDQAHAQLKGRSGSSSSRSSSGRSSGSSSSGSGIGSSRGGSSRSGAPVSGSSRPIRAVPSRVRTYPTPPPMKGGDPTVQALEMIHQKDLAESKGVPMPPLLFQNELNDAPKGDGVRDGRPMPPVPGDGPPLPPVPPGG